MYSQCETVVRKYLLRSNPKFKRWSHNRTITAEKEVIKSIWNLFDMMKSPFQALSATNNCVTEGKWKDELWYMCCLNSSSFLYCYVVYWGGAVIHTALPLVGHLVHVYENKLFSIIIIWWMLTSFSLTRYL